MIAKFVEISDVVKCSRTDIINLSKILLYKENKEVFDKISFDNDEIFLDPLLFAYFNDKYQQKMEEYFSIDILAKYFDVKARDKSIVYIEDIELLKEIHPLLISYFVESYKGTVRNKTPTFNSRWKEGGASLDKSLKIIKKHLPKFYCQFFFANKRVYLHDNPKILNFTSIETLGMLYFYVIEDSSVVYFIEELIHQGSHNYFYYVLYHKEEYFKIDSINTLMKDVTQKEWDYRSVYGAFHGLFTVAQRLENFDILLEKDVFKGQEKHELLGRLTDQFSRFHTGLELLDQDEIFTMKGQCLYKELDDLCVKYINKYKKLKTIFDLSHRDLDFRYNEFCKDNSYEEFLRMEEQGLFKFN